MANSPAPNVTLANLIKYSLGYVKLINPVLSRLSVSTGEIPKEYLDAACIYNPLSATGSIPITLTEFYTLNPKDVTTATETLYLAQKSFAEKLEEIQGKYAVNEYTKQIQLNFGYVSVELPTETDVVGDDTEEVPKEKPKESRVLKPQPLFSIPVNIRSSAAAEGVRKYHLELVDGSITPNIGFLYPLLQEDHYMDLATYLNTLELDGKLQLPVTRELVQEIWGVCKGVLKLSEVLFDEASFQPDTLTISLGSKSNYFLNEDLIELSKLDEEAFADTALASWIDDENMSTVETVSDDTNELFFPFPYDKYQLSALSIINNRASIVQGPPGTGKSQTIANLLCHLAANGKRVLFLSQKDQAIRGVKDKLKQLDVPYLYGYIPNRYSPLYTEADEKDSAANALLGIEHYLSSLDSQQIKIDTLQQKSTFTSFFNASIEAQRTYAAFVAELEKLSSYKLPLTSIVNYRQRFTREVFDSIAEIESDIARKLELAHAYESKHDTTNYDQMFTYVDFSKRQLYKDIDVILEAVEQEAFDGKNPLKRLVKSTSMKAKIRRLGSKLPREFIDAIERSLDPPATKSQGIELIKRLRNYAFFKDCQAQIRLDQEKLDLTLLENGLTAEGLDVIKLLRKHEPIDEIIAKTHRVLDITDEVSRLKFTNPNLVNESVYKLRSAQLERVRNYLHNRLIAGLSSVNENKTSRGILTRIGKSLQKSKKAYKTFDNLKHDPLNFEVLKEVIPIWMMDLEDVSRLVPLQKNFFDYIIIDEASQCNFAYALPAMFRAEHVMFFGDTEQMRDGSVQFKTNRSLLELASKFAIPSHLQIKPEGDAVQSVMDIGLSIGFKSQALLYHYRSPKELIGFSNMQFYEPKKRGMEVINNNYLTYKDTDQIMLTHVVDADKSVDVGDKSNLREAEYIRDLVQDLRSDPKTSGKSIGVLTFFNEQAVLLKQLIPDESIKVSIIEGIQGDERDIIIYSFVIADGGQKRRYVPLTGEGGEINKGLNEGRVNVAFSRARQQVHAVTSLLVHEWPDGIWIKRYLEYIQENGRTNFYTTELRPFDSKFEEDFYILLSNSLDASRYTIQNQVEASGFKIDFVVTDMKTQEKLAIECDGPCHFTDENSEIRVDSDYERQAILEAAGWRFYHVLYSDWLDPSIDRRLFVKSIVEQI